MNKLDEATKRYERLAALPVIFYRYRFADGIIVDKIERIKLGNHILVQSVTLLDNGKVRKSAIAQPYDIEFGVYDGHRKCIFFEECDKEREAALIFDKHYADVISKCELKVMDCILKRKALLQVFKKGETE